MEPVDFSERNRSIPDEWTGTAGTACVTGQRHFKEGRGDTMPALFLVSIVRLIEALCGQMREAREARPRPLCTDCVHAHVQYAVNGRRAIACTFAGAVRPVELDVMYCTDYRDRNTAPRLVQIGFAPTDRQS